ncbi:hypothetical protein GRAN_2230 [Granulicella sibirica]|uniref:Uncharacterized protein n=1 Tax=Granulicella sibirica TaxID=2479048 RepID=A0A4Q0T865_9BACT|nr:hypothetical protein GRAN_2230 [Granulicella sibirica]
MRGGQIGHGYLCSGWQPAGAAAWALFQVYAAMWGRLRYRNQCVVRKQALRVA